MQTRYEWWGQEWTPETAREAVRKLLRLKPTAKFIITHRVRAPRYQIYEKVTVDE